MKAAAMLLLVLVGCAVDPRTDAPQIESPDAGSVSVDAPIPVPGVCYAQGVSGEVHQGASSLEVCAIWNHDQELTGTVSITRAQDVITATFTGGITFNGQLVGNSVVLTHVEQHDFVDGCLWRATESLTGTLDPASCALTLAYHYAEAVVVDDGYCAIPCSGDGSLSLQISVLL